MLQCHKLYEQCNAKNFYQIVASIMLGLILHVLVSDLIVTMYENHRLYLVLSVIVVTWRSSAMITLNSLMMDRKR